MKKYIYMYVLPYDILPYCLAIGPEEMVPSDHGMKPLKA
jgi:hypothetical protein